MKNMADHADPWSVPVIVAQIPDTGLHREIEADRAARDAMAVVAGLREILSASASIDLTSDTLKTSLARASNDAIASAGSRRTNR